MIKAYLLLILAASICTKTINFKFNTFAKFHNQNPQNTWIAKLNQRFNYTDHAGLKKLCGTQVDKSAPDSEYADGVTRPKNPSRLLQSLPASFDLRAVYPECWSISYIRDQGQCGSCWAVASMSSISDRYCIKKSTAADVVQRQFSYEDVLECCSLTDCGTGPNKGCNGGFVTGGFRYSMKVGASTGENNGNYTTCKPYFLSPSDWAATAPSCVKSCNPQSTYTTPYSQDLVKIAGYTKISVTGIAQTVRNTKNAIYARGSVMAFMKVYQDFYAYSTGVYQRASNSYMGGHAVRIIGWGTSNDYGQAVNYWIVANSWGTSWGQDGYFWIVQGSNNCSIETSIIEGFI